MTKQWEERLSERFVSWEHPNLYKKYFVSDVRQYLWMCVSFFLSLIFDFSFEDWTLSPKTLYPVSLPVQVFCILTVQLLFTFTVVCVFTFSTVVKKAVQDHLWAYLSSFLIFAVVVITLISCQSVSRRHPWNIVGLVGEISRSKSNIKITTGSFVLISTYSWLT